MNVCCNICKAAGPEESLAPSQNWGWIGPNEKGTQWYCPECRRKANTPPIKILVYSPHSEEYILCCTPEAYQIMTRMVKETPEESYDWDHIQTHPLYPELRKCHEELLKLVVSRIEESKMEIDQVDKDFYPPLWSPSYDEDTARGYGVTFAEYECNRWQAAAIRAFIEDFDFELWTLPYGTTAEPIWSSIVCD